MKHRFRLITPYLPWLFLLLAVDAFAALLLWLADARAFFSMLLSIVLSTLLLFLALCCILLRQERRREQAFHAFLNDPDEYHEEALLETVNAVQRDAVRQIGRLLRSRQSAYAALQTQVSDYEEYVESWAHEIKTPLSLLTLLLDNRRAELPAAVNFKLDHIRCRIQESVDQMLFYARAKGMRKDYLFERLPLSDAVEEVLEDLMPLLLEKQFQIRSDLSGQTVCSDRRGLHFLLSQIISNSIKYSGKEPRLCFDLSPLEDRYVLRIRDNGIGVRSCDLPYLFEKGFTGDPGEGRKRATGMGLYLAREIAKDLNITLHASSVWGEGFEMQLSFPIVESALPYNG